ncbi:HAMP domain-containing sensor histidine kinase [Actinomadura sp. NPDC048394]|uniref:HAMP domain-containing sensor histidine kinase n=1 Tax=Actinomadura sp. NPDC048394 TaxID=3158223 RepID=UPI0033DFD3F5
MIAAVVSALVLTVLAVGIDLLVRSNEHDFAFAQTELAGRRISAAVRQRTLPSPIPPGAGGVRFIQVVGPDRRILNASPAAAGRPLLSSVVPPPANRVQEFTRCPAPGGDCLTIVAIRVTPASDSAVVYAGRPLPTILSSPILELLLAGCVVALTALASWTTWQVVGRTLRPVDDIRTQLAEITVSDLSHRVPEPPGDDEVARLARTANATLDRLERSVRIQHQFASDAAHELRTPIAGLRVNLEDLAMHPQDTDVETAAQAALRSADRLESIVADLLLLAQIGTGADLAEPLDLTGLVESGIRDHQAPTARNSAVPIRPRLTPRVRVQGVPAQLQRLLDGLLDNAQRHATAAVEVELVSDHDHAALTVADDGPGIPPEDRERVFERFTRVDTARSRDAGGTGLGLAIAREIASAHRGTLTIDDSPSGARFTLRLPLLAPPPDGVPRNSAAS